MTTLEQHRIDTSVEKWDEILSYLKDGGDTTYGFLQLAQSDLGAVAEKIACPYCRKQIVTEVQLLTIALKFSGLANDWGYAKGMRKRLSIVGKAIPLITHLSYLQLMKVL